MELKAQEKGILFALKVLEAKPKDLKIFIDNTAAYKALTERKDLKEAEIVFNSIYRRFTTVTIFCKKT